jgi:hypothetical protein
MRGGGVIIEGTCTSVCVCVCVRLVLVHHSSTVSFIISFSVPGSEGHGLLMSFQTIQNAFCSMLFPVFQAIQNVSEFKC